MGGIELRDGVLVVGRDANDLDQLATRFSSILSGPDVEMFTGGDNIWVARDDEMVPHLEVKFVDDEYDRASLENKITARITSVGAELPIGPLELQIAYKLHLSAQKDFEDAFHLYTMFEESLRTTALEHGVERLGVADEYERLQRD